MVVTGATPNSDRSFSLTNAMVSCAAASGCDIDASALHMALGLSMVPCATPADTYIGDWPMYARDAFLVDAAALFGMTVRDLHPPDAARGLGGAAEFAQHFDASYKPLILRALENDQPVICGRGFAGHGRLMWGRILESCDEGVGFRGAVYSGAVADGLCEPGDATTDGAAVDTEILQTPPVQVYVVESMVPKAADPVDVLRAGVSHAKRALSGRVGSGLGVMMGLGAIDAWTNVLHSIRGAGPARPGLDQNHVQLAASISKGLTSTVHFLSTLQASGAGGGPAAYAADSLMAGCRKLGRKLSRSCDQNYVRDAISAEQGRAKLVDDLRGARVAMIDLSAIIDRAVESL